ncbi:MAG: hypothetical protein Q8O40_14780 [Chloroflexota bacterium]|nr:hypothetical protein [Chloroflexota bacterium]
MIEFEKLGIPTAGFATHEFEGDWEHSGRLFGLPNVPYVIIPYTMTSRNRDEARKDAEGAFETLVKTLTSRPPDDGRIASARARPAEVEKFKGSDRHEAWEDFNRAFMDRGWADGFPLIAPTPQLVEQFVKAAKRDPSEVVGHLAPAYGAGTVEKIAINTAMAGCQPEHLPILLAAVEAISQTPESVFPARSIMMSTSPTALLMVINGPIVDKLGIQSGRCALGPGKPGRVNTVLGRALRLIAMNVGHCYPGFGDMDTIGSPLKYSMCIAENEGKNPWEPFHVERGFKKEQSTVTVFGVSDVIHMANYQRNAELHLTAWAARASTGGHRDPIIPSRVESDDSTELMFLVPDHARNLAQDGYNKKSIREFISKNAKIPLKFMVASLPTSLDSLPKNLEWIFQMDPDTLMSTVPNPETINIVVVGGPTGKSDWVRCAGAPTITREIVTGR